MENSSDDMDSYDVDDYIFGGDPDDSDAETVVDGSSAETDNSNEDNDFIKIVNYVITHDLAILQDMLKKKYEKNPKYDINKLFEGNTLLMLAVKFNHTAVIKYLLTIENIDVNIKDKEMGLTPLMVAVMNNKTNIVKMLVEKGADIINFNEGDDNEIDIRSLSTKANSNIYKILDEKQFNPLDRMKQKIKSPFLDTFPLDEHSIPKSTTGKLTDQEGGGEPSSKTDFERFIEITNKINEEGDGYLKKNSKKFPKIRDNILHVYRFMMTYLIKVFERTLNKLNPEKFKSFNYAPESLDELIEMVGPILKGNITYKGEWKQGISALNNKIEIIRAPRYTEYDFLPVIEESNGTFSAVSQWWDDKKTKTNNDGKKELFTKSIRPLENDVIEKKTLQFFLVEDTCPVLHLMYITSLFHKCGQTITDLLIRNNTYDICAPHYDVDSDHINIINAEILTEDGNEIFVWKDNTDKRCNIFTTNKMKRNEENKFLTQEKLNSWSNKDLSKYELRNIKSKLSDYEKIVYTIIRCNLNGYTSSYIFTAIRDYQYNHANYLFITLDTNEIVINIFDPNGNTKPFVKKRIEEFLNTKKTVSNKELIEEFLKNKTGTYRKIVVKNPTSENIHSNMKRKSGYIGGGVCASVNNMIFLCKVIFGKYLKNINNITTILFHGTYSVRNIDFEDGNDDTLFLKLLWVYYFVLQSLNEYSGYRKNFIKHIQEIKAKKKTDNIFIKTFNKLKSSNLRVKDDDWIKIYDNMLEETKKTKAANISNIFKKLDKVSRFEEDVDILESGFFGVGE